MRYLFIILLPFTLPAQAIDTLTHAKAYHANYLPTTTYGLTTSNHPYAVGFNLYSGLPLEAVRIDLTTKQVSYKTVTGTLSDPAALWMNVFDSSGNLYFGFNYALRRVVKFNLKDSIYFKNLGNGFPDGQSLAYNLSLGLDNHIYGSASSGDGTSWFDYNPFLDNMVIHSAVDANQAYGLTIQGDTNWIYMQTGQSPSIDYWAVQKGSDYKKKLFSIYSSSRFNIRTGQGFCYVWPAVDTLYQTFRLKDTTTTPVPTYNAVIPIEYQEVNKTVRTVFTNYDDAKGKLFYTTDGGRTNDSVSITSPQATPDDIRLVFSRDTGNIYYVGNYYGSWYRYNQAQDSAYRLGKTNYNVYSAVQWDDTTFYIGAYPNGALLKYVTTKPWTVRVVQGTTITSESKTSNPALMTSFRTSTVANFHHASQVIKDDYGNIIAAGDVIRVANTCSIAVYNVSRDSAYGYDCNKIIGQGFSSMCKWNGRIYLATNNSYGGTAKIYVYNPLTNLMEDSITAGLNDYGTIFICGRILYGVTNQFTLYKIDLSTKKIIYTYTTNYWAYSPVVMPDQTLGISITQSMPSDFWPYGTTVFPVAFGNLYPCHNDMIIARLQTIYKVRNAYAKTFDFSTLIGRVNYIKNKIGLPYTEVAGLNNKILGTQ